MDDDEYEILPHREIANLKKEVEALKRGDTASSGTSQTSLDDLKHSIDDLLTLFKTATQELQNEEKEEASLSKKVDKLTSQNKVIADALLSISDKLDQLLVKKQDAPRFDQRQDMGMGTDKPFPQFNFQEPFPQQERFSSGTMPPRPMPPMGQPSMAPPRKDFPSPDFSFGQPPAPFPAPTGFPQPGFPPQGNDPGMGMPDFGIPDEPKKKRLFGMFGKK